MGCGRGYGRFAGRAYLSKSEEVDELEDEAKAMEADLKALKERISEIKGE
jgi:wobble nucleotide-excising tRNase